VRVRRRRGQSRPPTPASRPVRVAGFRTSAQRLLAMMVRPRKRLVAAALALGIISILLNLAFPAVLGYATNLVFAGVAGAQTSPGQTKAEVIAQLRAQGDAGRADLLGSVDFTPGEGIDLGRVGIVLLVALAVQLVSGLCWIGQGLVTANLIQQMARRLREQVAAKLNRLPVSYFDSRPRGEVLSRATNDVDNVVQSLQQTLSQLTNSLLLMIGLLAVMLWISPPLALVALLSVPVSVFVLTTLGKRAQRLFAEQWRVTGQLTTHTEESYAGHSVVKVFGREAEHAAGFRATNDALFRSGYRAQLLSGAIPLGMTLIGNLGYVLMAVLGGLRVASGTMSIGEVQAFIQYTQRLSGPLTLVTSLGNLVQSGIVSAQRVFELLDTAEQRPDPPAPATTAQPRGHIDFESISFRYTPDRPLIDNLSLSAPPGRTVAIVGPTGAGKTTLVNLLMRFYEPDSGRITLDGVDISTMPRDELRASIGMVLQETWLFRGSIAENIAYGREGASRSEIEQAALSAHADHFIRTLPAGFDTVIDDEYAATSAGEKQLITIARAFLANPTVLLLDEATSAVDAHTELMVRRAVHGLSRGRTTLVIAHRLSTIRDADVILVMDNGAIVEQGRHEELLAARGRYAALYAAQFARSAAGTEQEG
jgi:ATP-binding cassette, subfamily B, multidrug efflux pump